MSDTATDGRRRQRASSDGCCRPEYWVGRGGTAVGRPLSRD